MPDTTVGTNSSGKVTTNHLDIVVDDVTYGTGGRWGSDPTAAAAVWS